jgi:hypothetical protein
LAVKKTHKRKDGSHKRGFPASREITRKATDPLGITSLAGFEVTTEANPHARNRVMEMGENSDLEDELPQECCNRG